jgi:endonuclease/exonuclease/phosphatase (EEP) superfamily protein YafD
MDRRNGFMLSTMVFEDSHHQGPHRRDASPIGQAQLLHRYPSDHSITPEELVVVSWNLAKPRTEQAFAQVEELSADHQAQLLAFQESTQGLRLPEHLGSHFVRSHGTHGVTSAASVQPTTAEGIASRSRELRVATRKMALITTYPLPDGRSVLLANVHALNFDRHGRRFTQQMQDLAWRIKEHSGPILFCGDFNTWNAGRLQILCGVVESMGLIEIEPSKGSGRRGHAGVLGNRILGVDTGMHLDRLFQRGMELLEAHWLEDYDISDHVPLLARLQILD